MMDDDLRDLLDPGDDPRVAAALRRIQDDLLVAPDEITAARHRRQRRALTARPVRRTAVAVFLAVAGTGAALSATAPAPFVPGAPAGEALEPIDEHTTVDPEPRVTFAPSTGLPVPDLPSFSDRLPAPALRTITPGPDTPDTTAPERGPVVDRTPPGPPADRPGAERPGTDRPGTDARPTEPGPPARTTPAPAPPARTPAPAPAPAAPAAPSPAPAEDATANSGGDGPQGAVSTPASDEPRADNARDGGDATPAADGGR